MVNNKWLFAIIALLVVTNGYFLLGQVSSGDDNEMVAKVGNVEITKEMWSEQLTSQYGENVLKDMINREVVFQLAKKQGLKIAPEVIDQEVNLYKVMYDQSSHGAEEYRDFDEEALRKEIEYNLLLEEIYTQDIVISEEEIKQYFQENKSLYEREQMYFLSHIVVSTKAEIDEVVSELNAGSSFAALAMERSADVVTSVRGGDIGYVEDGSPYVPVEYFATAESLALNEVSSPIATEAGYAVIIVKEKIESATYTFDEMKREIRRQLALQQVEGDINAEQLWNELGVVWKYNKY
jgi:foldase protein PrsA